MTGLSKLQQMLKIFLIRQKYDWNELLQYRFQFIVYLAYAVLQPIITLVFISTIYGVSNGIAGWSYFQLLFLAALSGLTTSLFQYFVEPQRIFNDITRGGLDKYMTKPFSVFLSLLSYGNKLVVANMLGNISLLVYCMLNLQFTLLQLALLAVAVAAGTTAFIIFMMAFIFNWHKYFTGGWWISTLAEMAQNAAYWPISIFGTFGYIILTILIPIGLAVFVPAAIFTGKISIVTYALFVVVSLLAIYIFHGLYRKGLAGYNSAAG